MSPGEPQLRYSTGRSCIFHSVKPPSMSRTLSMLIS